MINLFLIFNGNWKPLPGGGKQCIGYVNLSFVFLLLGIREMLIISTNDKKVN